MSEKKKPVGPAEKDDERFGLANASSHMDCTGLIPTPPLTEAEMDSYLEIFNFQPPATEEAAAEHEEAAEETIRPASDSEKTKLD
ncbi:MAG: hypothetical protein IKL80_01250 [Clostridia bacterium]|nr:hypothetical protein [Clostridia bacterium]